MKRFFAALLALVMILSLAACGKGGQDGTGSSGGTSAPPSDASADSPSQEQAVTLALSIGNYSASSTMGQAMTMMAEKIKEYSGGSVTCDLYTDGSLGDLSSQVDSVVNGSIDILVAGDSYYSTYVPQMQIFELPFLYESAAEARHVLDSEAGQAVSNLFEGTGINILRYWELGMRQLTNNKAPITSIEDAKGLRLRVLPVEIQVYAWEQFGCQVVAIDGSELYSALQTGVVDAQENPLEGIYTNKIYEVQKYITLTNHVFTPAALSISEKTVSKLSEAQMEAVVKAADETTEWLRQALDENEKAAQEALGAECEICDSPDLSGFVEKAPVVYEKFTEIVPGTDELFDLIYKARDEFRA